LRIAATINAKPTGMDMGHKLAFHQNAKVLPKRSGHSPNTATNAVKPTVTLPPGLDQPEQSNGETDLRFDDDQKHTKVRRQCKAQQGHPVNVGIQQTMEDRWGNQKCRQGQRPGPQANAPSNRRTAGSPRPKRRAQRSLAAKLSGRAAQVLQHAEFRMQ